MSLVSMTGFARVDGHCGAWDWILEVRSVNGRGLDLRFRMPSGLDAVEQGARKLLQARLGRGNVSVSLNMQSTARGDSYRVNEAWLAQLAEVARTHAPDGRIDPASLLSVRGVVEAVDQDDAADDGVAERDAAILESFRAAVEQIDRARREEGARLAAILSEVVDGIEALVNAAEATDAARPEARKARLQKALSELLEQSPPVAEDRLAQELAIQFTRSDVREEIDRLRAHIGQARDLLVAPDPVGRRFDFLSQEFNREANTLCSKSGDVALTRVGMDLKVAIDRLREQVQNLE
ncbi:MAG: YicC/YloC family endoribonuclease [Pseudomonadota bacterium]|nr:YicC/YloC family endoribonuclease [Pseudomonadota bacterium]